MSGFFMIRRSALDLCVRRMSAIGFKILVDLFASSERPLRFREIPYTFRSRHAGESKLDNQVAWDYGMLLLDKLIGHIVPARFVAFALIGSLGVIVHMAVLTAAFKGALVEFPSAQALATITAMIFNFSFNNIVTYRDKRLRGVAWWRGLASFMLVCGVGAIANVGVANYLFDRDGGWIIAALAGIVVGAVWNYAVTSLYTWGKAR
jgi:dolichol-phosphate mannosyltransferase